VTDYTTTDAVFYTKIYNGDYIGIRFYIESTCMMTTHCDLYQLYNQTILICKLGSINI